MSDEIKDIIDSFRAEETAAAEAAARTAAQTRAKKSKSTAAEKSAKSVKAEKPEKSVKADKPEKTVKAEKPAKSAKSVKAEKPEKSAKSAKAEKPEKPEKTVKTEKPEKSAKSAKAEKAKKSAKSAAADVPAGDAAQSAEGKSGKEKKLFGRKKSAKPAAEPAKETEAAAAEPLPTPGTGETGGTDAAATVEENPDGAKKPKKSKKDKARRRLAALIVMLVMALILCGSAVLGGYLVTQSTTNLPNVYLGEVYVGSMTREQTIAALQENEWEKTTGGELEVTLPEGVKFSVDYLQADASLSCEEAADLAFAYGHGEDWFDNLFTYLSDLLIPRDLADVEHTINTEYVAGAVDTAVDEFEKKTADKGFSVDEKSSTLRLIKGAGQVTLDRAAICAKIGQCLLAGEKQLEWTELSGELKAPDFGAIAAELNKDVADAYYDPEKDEIIPEVKGVAVEADKAVKAWNDAAPLTEVSVPIQLIDPAVTAEELEELLFRDCLGTTTTYTYGSTTIRISNINLACEKLNGIILMPGDSFSYNGTIGERTTEAGFGYAPAYNGDAVVYEIGGGICQVSSTLYNSVLAANLQVDARTCHNFAIAYLPKGLDATVSWPNPDFQFTNNRDYPIKIVTSTDRNSLTIEIWGSNIDGTYVVPMGAWWEVYDEEYPTVQIGWGARSYRYLYDADGNLLEKIPEEYSYYHLHPEDIKWPAKPDDDDDDEGEDESEDTDDLAPPSY